MSSQIDVKDLLKIDFGPEDRRLQAVLRAVFGATDTVAPREPLWNAQFFGLDNSRLFRDLTEDQQREITLGLSRGLLTEAYAIEKIGMGFTAKMSLICDRLEERMLYSAFAYDEAAHFHKISGFFDELPTGLEQNPFLGFLSHLIENEERAVLVVIIQVLLEGWGMSHYRLMADAATDPRFQETMKSIIRDEARHHGSGLAILSRAFLTDAQRIRVRAIMSEMLMMVRAGPQSTVRMVEEVAGGLTKDQTTRLFEDLGAVEHSQLRLDVLRSLIPPECAFLLTDLSEAGHFTPMSPAECAAF